MTMSSTPDPEGRIESSSLLGVPLHLADLDQVLRNMEQWIQQRDRCHWIYQANSHGILEAHKHANFMEVLRSADLSLVDGKVTNWFLSRRASQPVPHIRGTDLLLGFCKIADSKGYRNFFYGDTDEVLSLMSENLLRQFPSLRIAGVYSPPFREMTPTEDAQITEMINQADPDVLWVGLGLPKQERWIFAHLKSLKVPVMAAVGAAFRFICGKSDPPPTWVSNAGLEWFWRVLHEPRRLWRRAFVYGPHFVGLSLLELAGLKKFR